MVSTALEYWDAIVNNNDGQAEYQTIQAAIDANERTIWVKSGTYAGFTQDQASSKIFIEPGSTISSDCNFTGANCSFVVGAGTTISGEIDVTTGTGAYIRFENGCSVSGMEFNTARCYVNGGGWGTLSDGGIAAHGLRSNAADCIYENIALETAAGGGQSFFSFIATGSAPRNIISKIKVVASDSAGIGFSSGADDVLVMGCAVLAADGDGTQGGARTRIIGNYVDAPGDDGIVMGGAGDDSVIVGNVVKDPGGDSVEITANAENCVVVGNRLDGAVNDLSGTSTVSNNDETAF